MGCDTILTVEMGSETGIHCRAIKAARSDAHERYAEVSRFDKVQATGIPREDAVERRCGQMVCSGCDGMSSYKKLEGARGALEAANGASGTEEGAYVTWGDQRRHAKLCP